MKSNCRFSSLRCVSALSLLCSSLPAWAQAAASRAATVIDSLPHAKTIDQASISPDGTQVAYVVEGELAIVIKSVDGFQAKDGANRAVGAKLTFTDGRRLFLGGSAPGANPDSPEKKK